jgi:hypothetical protein
LFLLLLAINYLNLIYNKHVTKIFNGKISNQRVMVLHHNFTSTPPLSLEGLLTKVAQSFSNFAPFDSFTSFQSSVVQRICIPGSELNCPKTGVTFSIYRLRALSLIIKIKSQA